MATAEQIRLIPNDYQLYKGLDPAKKEIRLLRIKDAQSSDDELSCCLVRAYLTECPPFKALSYCWGDISDTTSIWLTFNELTYTDSYHRADDFGQSNTTLNLQKDSVPMGTVAFRITTNLQNALRSVRMADGPSTFIWADMLCINQSDYSERSQQVAFMPGIFSKASEVLVWLGGDIDSRSSILPILDAPMLEFLNIIDPIQMIYSFTISDYQQFEEEVLDDEATREMLCYRLKLLGDLRHANRCLSDDIASLYILWRFWHSKSTSNWSNDRLKVDSKQLLSLIGEILCSGSLLWQFCDELIHIYNGSSTEIPFLNFEGSSRILTHGSLDFSRAASALFSNPWFSRVWVIQEVWTNQNVNVRHGTTTVPWKVITNLAGAMLSIIIAQISYQPRRSYEDEMTLQKLVFILKFWVECTAEPSTLKEFADHFEPRSLISLLPRAHFHGSTVARDKLYALYPLDPDLQGIEFSPNYLEATHQTYNNFTSEHIRKTGSLAILSLAGLIYGDQDRSQFSTWSPVYHLPPERMQRVDKSGLGYEANIFKRIQRWIVSSPGRLILLGVHLTTVRYAFPLDMSSGKELGNVELRLLWKTIFREHRSILAKRSSQKMTHDLLTEDPSAHFGIESLFEVVCLGVLQCIRAENSRGIKIRHLQKRFSTEWSYEDSWASLQMSITNFETIRRWSIPNATFSSTESLRFMGPGHTLFLTEEGSLGVGPSSMSKGDLVTLLDGGKVPFLIRRNLHAESTSRAEKIQRGETFNLVGDCYLEGAMHGQIFKSPRWRGRDLLYQDPLDYDPDFQSPGAGNERGYKRGIFRRRPFVLV